MTEPDLSSPDSSGRIAKLLSSAGIFRLSTWWMWIGFVIYLCLGAYKHEDFVTRAYLTFLIAPLVTLPFGLRLMMNIERWRHAQGHSDAERWKFAGLAATGQRLLIATQLPLALFAIPAILLPADSFDGAQSLKLAACAVWSLWALAAAGIGLCRVMSAGVRKRPLESLCFDVGLIYAALGGGWLVLFIAGVQPMGFDLPIVLFTAIHFHFAGVGVPFMAGALGNWLKAHGEAGIARKLWQIASITAMGGIMLVAVGITAAKLGAPSYVQMACASPLIAALVLLNLLVVWKVIAGAGVSIWARVLLALSVSANLFAMGMAFCFVYSIATGEAIYAFGKPIAMPLMADVHGLVNAALYLFVGFAGWLIAWKGVEAVSAESPSASTNASEA